MATDSRGISRRQLLRHASVGAAFGIAGLSGREAVAAVGGPRIVGSGRISGTPVESRTIPSPSDFGFAADQDGGVFVCSMFGPETGGFKGCSIMTVEGTIAARSLQFHRGVATFAGVVAIFVSPDVFTGSGAQVLSIAPTPFTVEARLGRGGKAYMILQIPAVIDALGGNTGGYLAYGRIERKRIRQPSRPSPPVVPRSPSMDVDSSTRASAIGSRCRHWPSCRSRTHYLRSTRRLRAADSLLAMT